MGLVKEPIEVDFFVDPKPVTKEELQKISDYIKSDKETRKMLKTKEKRPKHTTVYESQQTTI